eukprot:9167078-Alexandrium_andersonii.AAC.1
MTACEVASHSQGTLGDVSRSWRKCSQASVDLTMARSARSECRGRVCATEARLTSRKARTGR